MKYSILPTTKVSATVALTVLCFASFAQKGIPFITNFSLPASMNTQNYQIVQGDNCSMYVLNQNGVFGFDGYSWEQLPVTGQPAAITYLDKLFIGGDETLGYFKKNLKGVNIYAQLDELGGELFYLFHHFNNTLYTVGANGVYRIRRVEPYRVEPYYTIKDSTQMITGLFNINKTLFAVINKQNICRIYKQEATQIRIELNATEEIAFTFNHNNTQIVGTTDNKIYQFDGKQFTQILIKDQAYINESYLTGGISLNNNTIALSTLIGGCIMINSKTGETTQIINYASGLPDDEVTAMGKDNQGGLWLIHGMGISRIDTDVPLTSYQHFDGLNGNILSVVKYSSSLYVGSSDGLYKLSEQRNYAKRDKEDPIKPIRPISIMAETTPDVQQSTEKSKKGLLKRIFGRDQSVKTNTELPDMPDKNSTTPPIQEQKKEKRKHVYQLISGNHRYEKINGISGKVNQLIVWNNKLLVGSSTGLYSITANTPEPIIENEYVYCIIPGDYNKNHIYIGGNGTLYQLNSKSAQLNVKKIVTLDNEKILSAAELSNSAIILCTDYRMYRINSANSARKQQSTVTGSNNRLVWPTIRKLNNQFIVITPNQLYQYHQQGDSISEYKLYPTQSTYSAFSTNTKTTWLRVGQVWASHPETPINKQIAKYLGLLSKVNYISNTDSSEVWAINNYSQIYRLTPTATNDTATKMLLYVKQVIDKVGNSLNTNYVKLESDNNAFKVKLSAPFFLKEKAVEYQYKLQGVMSEWSDWGNAPEKDFPFFPPGNHTLLFRARDAMGNISKTQEYPFSITPPFYQTVWFYILAGALLIATISIAIRIREQKLIKEKLILEQRVKERTITIEEQKEAIEQQRDEIATQRDQIVLQNQDIIKSISYAKRIQTAVMPGKAITDAILGDYFILLKPRDIVSGDFYWTSQKNGRIVVAAADCTGHGVPGAFMSLMGITLLTEIVKNTNDPQPHIILNELRHNIKRALSQIGSENAAKDGMDVSLCVIDPLTHTLLYAGAYNPIYLVRNSELQEFKADKMPVGVHINEKISFTLHKTQLQENDCIYMFSDGYIDQFGGTKNRKFMSKNFKTLLKTLSTKTMEEQKTALDNTIDQWIGPYDQLDDILVIGIRYAPERYTRT